MSVDECISPEELAQLFHRYYGVLAGCLDGRTGGPAWDEIDTHQRRLMIATARLVLDDLAAKQRAGDTSELTAAPEDRNRSYFAKPGQAEWGC